MTETNSLRRFRPRDVQERFRPRAFALVGGALLVAAVSGPLMLVPAAASAAAAGSVAGSVADSVASSDSTSIVYPPNDGFVVVRGTAASSMERAERLSHDEAPVSAGRVAP